MLCIGGKNAIWCSFKRSPTRPGGFSWKCWRTRTCFWLAMASSSRQVNMIIIIKFALYYIPWSNHRAIEKSTWVSVFAVGRRRGVTAKTENGGYFSAEDGCVERTPMPVGGKSLFQRLWGTIMRMVWRRLIAVYLCQAGWMQRCPVFLHACSGTLKEMHEEGYFPYRKTFTRKGQ